MQLAATSGAYPACRRGPREARPRRLRRAARSTWERLCKLSRRRADWVWPAIRARCSAARQLTAVAQPPLSPSSSARPCVPLHRKNASPEPALHLQLRANASATFCRCVRCWSALLRKLEVPAQPKRGQFVQSGSSPRPVATANLHRSGNQWLRCSIAEKVGWGSLSGFAHASVRGLCDARWWRAWLVGIAGRVSIHGDWY